MRIKKLAAALMAVVMVVTMMSSLAVSASAESALGGSVKAGLDVSGVSLPGDCFVVSSAWSNLAAGKQVNVVLGGTTYKAYYGRNAFAELADAVAAASNNMTIYLTAGIYKTTVNVNVSHLKICGPYAGVSPNAVVNATEALDLAAPNPARPAAVNGSSADEAVLNCQINLYQLGSYLTVDGVTIGGNGFFNLNEGGKDRYGTHLKNSIVNTDKGTLFAMGRGRNYSFLVENNRVLKANQIVNIGGFGGIDIRSNYFNTSGEVVFTHSLASASMGVPVNIINNYWENSNTIFSYDPSDLSYPSAYSVKIQGNYVNNFTGGYIVLNEYLAMKSVPGLNIFVEDNVFKGIKNTPFYFPYVGSVANLTKARFLVNINENYFELPQSVTFIDAPEAFLYLNCAKNYYTSSMSEDRVVKFKDSDFVYCPYYADPEMATLVGGSEIESINLDANQFGVVLDNEKKEITIDFCGSGIDFFDFSTVLGVSAGCTWKMYETETLENEIKDKVVYFDGEKTDRYVAVSAADGSAKTVYRLYLQNDKGTKSELYDIIFDTAAVPEPIKNGANYYKYNLDSEVALLDYDLQVSTGATYSLWKDSQCQTTPLGGELANFIPYSETADKGYTVYVKVVSQDGNSTTKYTLEFIRPRSENFDPGVLSVKLPAENTLVRNSRKLIYYYCVGYEKQKTFDFVVTPGAEYAIYADQACTKLLSSGSEVKALNLEEGSNIFYVRIKDEKATNLYKLFVENGERSGKNAIIGVNGANAYTIVNDRIKVDSGVGDEFSLDFITDSIYATVSVYADAGRLFPISYTSSPVTEDNHTVDVRTFTLETKLPTSIYYVVCVAENGASKAYTLEINKILFPGKFNDVEEGKWYTEYVNKAINSGMMVGSKVAVDAEGKDIFAYRPNDFVTRQEAAVIICRLAGYNPTAFSKVELPFTDLNSIGSWARDYVKVCYYNGYMVGTSATTFTPKSTLTRQEMMSMIARIFKLKKAADLSSFTDAGRIASWARADVEACVAAGIIVGSNHKLNPTGLITRAQIATVMVQLEEKVGLFK